LSRVGRLAMRGRPLLSKGHGLSGRCSGVRQISCLPQAGSLESCAAGVADRK